MQPDSVSADFRVTWLFIRVKQKRWWRETHRHGAKHLVDVDATVEAAHVKALEQRNRDVAAIHS